MRIFAILLCLFTLTIGLLGWHQVSTSLTAADHMVIAQFLKRHHLIPPAKSDDYQQQIAFIRAAQTALLQDIPVGEPIPPDHTREPQDLFAAGTGLCFDRSRTLQKVMRYSGLEARQAFVLSRAPDESILQTLTASNRASHAVLEVKTSQGWLTVDTNAAWLALDKMGRPVSLHAMAKQFVQKGKAIEWTESPADHIFKQNFIPVFGLYSRHGRFYPPYNVLPDVNYSEFFVGIIDQ